MSKTIVRDFPFIGSDRLEQFLDIRKSQRVELRSKLTSPLYWYQFPGGRKIFWNWVLIRDYLLNGGDTPAHQRLIEEYLGTLEPPQKCKTPSRGAA
jgi:hypothetical protein